MRLLVTSEDYTVHKVLAAARLAGIRLGQPELVQQQQLQALHPLARGMLLETAQGHVAQHHAILRYIAEAAPAAYLYGRSDFQQAEVRTSTCALHAGSLLRTLGNECSVSWESLGSACCCLPNAAMGLCSGDDASGGDR